MYTKEETMVRNENREEIGGENTGDENRVGAATGDHAR